MKRAIILVLDSFGIGAADDAESFGDVGADTLGHIAAHCARAAAAGTRARPLTLPTLTRLGLMHAAHASTGRYPEGCPTDVEVEGAYGYAREISSGKDTPSGHWEIAGAPVLFDWGYFWFLTQPLYMLLHWFAQIFGNYGLAILATTVVVKALFFPLANKSYESMAKMKLLQPEMEKLRERFKDDRAKQQQELMALYREKKINPMAGCLPILLQVPVFFALYKVLDLNIDMRQAPFFGWIQDLSAPDPTSIFNLFGLLPWGAPELHLIGGTLGAWPLMMGVTMFLQQKMNPAPPDPVQAKVFMAMPFIFTVMLAPFPAGLVIYWAWNNTLSVLQQWVILRRMKAHPVPAK